MKHHRVILVALMLSAEASLSKPIHKIPSSPSSLSEWRRSPSEEPHNSPANGPPIQLNGRANQEEQHSNIVGTVTVGKIKYTRTSDGYYIRCSRPEDTHNFRTLENDHFGTILASASPLRIPDKFTYEYNKDNSWCLAVHLQPDLITLKKRWREARPTLTRSQCTDEARKLSELVAGQQLLAWGHSGYIHAKSTTRLLVPRYPEPLASHNVFLINYDALSAPPESASSHADGKVGYIKEYYERAIYDHPLVYRWIRRFCTSKRSVQPPSSHS